MQKILIIEDDMSIAEIERDYLTAAGFDVRIAVTGKMGLDAALTQKYHLIILDLMLPGMDGFCVCEALRAKLDIPILMVTAKLEEDDKIRGLGLGADDYIVKPFSLKELVARVKANLAQHERLRGGEYGSSVLLRCGDLELDTAMHTCTKKGVPIELKNKEYELLLYFFNNSNIVISREMIYDRVWGLDAIGDSVTVAVHINRLREKLEDDPSNPQYIQTIRGAGYRFNR